MEIDDASLAPDLRRKILESRIKILEQIADIPMFIADNTRLMDEMAKKFPTRALQVINNIFPIFDSLCAKFIAKSECSQFYREKLWNAFLVRINALKFSEHPTDDELKNILVKSVQRLTNAHTPQAFFDAVNQFGI